MKIRVLSDLHMELWRGDPTLPRVECDLVVIAGDIDIGAAGICWAAEAFEGTPVLYVLGNHEYHINSLSLLPHRAKMAAEGTNVAVLADESIIVRGTRFFGTTLWTDFALKGDESRGAAMREAGRAMLDYRNIVMDDPEGADLRVTPLDLLEQHQRSRRRLEKALESSRWPTVVISHHPPSGASLGTRMSDRHPLAPAYASNLEELVLRRKPKLWIHGHTHAFVDYRIGETRVVSNPRGCPDSPCAEWDPGFVVEV